MILEDFYRLTSERIPTAAEFLAFAEGQGWKVVVRADGTPALRADRTDPLAVSLARMLSREPYRTNVLRLVTGKDPEPPPRLREWLWPCGMLVAEQKGFASVGDEKHHPGLAGWWRWRGESDGAWRVIDGRAELVAGVDPRSLRPRPPEPQPAEHLGGPVPRPRGPDAEPGPVGGGGGQVPVGPMQGRLFGQGSVERGGAEGL